MTDTETTEEAETVSQQELAPAEGKDIKEAEAPKPAQKQEIKDAATEAEKKVGSVPFGEMLEIKADRRLPHLDAGPVKAYEVVGKGKYSGTYIALLGEFHLVPRISAVQIFSNFSNSNIAKLVHSGVVDWLPTNEQRYVFIYENIPGKPILPKNEKQAMGLRQEIVLGNILKQLVSVLRDFRDKDFVHGNIRADNIFSISSTYEKIILGDCLSTPPSLLQPCIYEPVERAMADANSKGLGSRADDMYALGVTLAVLLRSFDPLEGMSDREIIKLKIENGSYVSLVGKDRLTGPVLELLRGLLYDDPLQRWTFEEIEAWLDGQRLSPKQLTKKIKAARPLTFNNKRYLRPSVLAMELQDNVPEAAQMVEDGTLEQWLERSLEIKDADELIGRALKSAEESGRGPVYKDRLLCRISIILDHEAPIRIRGLSMRPEGIGQALVQSIIFKKDLQPFVDLTTDQAILFWLEFQKTTKIDSNALIGRFESCRAFVRQKNIGYGIERCVYILSPECPCLSEKLKGYYVRNPEDLMYALEDLCAKGRAPLNFLDRHIVAFVSVKDRNMIDPFLIEINSKERHQQIIGTLRTLATIQNRSRMEKFPAITKAIAEMLDPVYERYHDRDFRDSMKNKVNELKELGDINKIRAILDNEENLKKDFRNFRKAMFDYHELKTEKTNLEKQMKQEGDFGKSTGRQVAAMVSGLLAGVVILLFTIVAFSGS